MSLLHGKKVVYEVAYQDLVTEVVVNTCRVFILQASCSAKTLALSDLGKVERIEPPTILNSIAFRVSRLRRHPFNVDAPNMVDLVANVAPQIWTHTRSKRHAANAQSKTHPTQETQIESRTYVYRCRLHE